jgi:hypothetical protein
MKNTYKHLGAKAHNSRLDAIGQAKLDHYNHLYGRNYGPEWAEASTLHVEYLVTAGRYNQDHPKWNR